MKGVERVEVAQAVRLLRQRANCFITLGTLNSRLRAAAEEAVAAGLLPASELEALNEDFRHAAADHEEIRRITAALEECGCKYLDEVPDVQEVVRACRIISASHFFVVKQGLILAAKEARALPDELASGGSCEWLSVKDCIEVWLQAARASLASLDELRRILAGLPGETSKPTQL